MAKKFSFKLESLLKLKKNQEEILKLELGKAIEKLEREKEKLLNFQKEKSRCEEDINKKVTKGISVERLRDYNHYLSSICDEIETQKDNVNSARKNVDRYREDMIKIKREGQMLEKLKEKKLQDYMIELHKEEQLINDEISNFKRFEASQEDFE